MQMPPHTIVPIHALTQLMPRKTIMPKLATLLLCTFMCAACQSTSSPTTPSDEAPVKPTSPIVTAPKEESRAVEPDAQPNPDGEIRTNYEPPRAGKRYIPAMPQGVLLVSTHVDFRFEKANHAKIQSAFKAGKVTEVSERAFLDRHAETKMDPTKPIRRNADDYHIYSDAKFKLMATPISKTIEALNAKYKGVDFSARAFECMSGTFDADSGLELCVSKPTVERPKDATATTPAMKWVVLEVTDNICSGPNNPC